MIRNEVFSVKGQPSTCYLSILAHILRFNVKYESEPNAENNKDKPMVLEGEPTFVAVDFFEAIMGMNSLIDVSPLPNRSAYEQYSKQVILGINADGFEYSYYERLFEYPSDAYTGFNQIKAVVDRLKRNPQSRRAVAVTWHPPRDLLPGTFHTPCLQLFQIHANKSTGNLDLDTVWRSRDMFKAFPMNFYAIVILWSRIALELGIAPGIYRDYTIHPHIYDVDVEDVKNTIRRHKRD